jgi:hypothetical protein
MRNHKIDQIVSARGNNEMRRKKLAGKRKKVIRQAQK